ncbi:MAG: radical SAM protein [Methanomassiliicoccales archaeon]|nr:radical SAM protein [Methanomassiliicoccales archaeon]
MRNVTLYRPGKQFPSLSVTGTECALMCEHCQARFLQEMLPARTPEELCSLAQELYAKGATGFLLSGGCDRSGKVPLSSFLPTVQGIKRTTPLLVNLHPGLVTSEEAIEIARSGADRISFDLTLDDDVIRHRMHLGRSSQDNLRSFRHLCRAAPGKVAPHILLGAGREDKELEAVRTAANEDVPCVILLSLLGEKVEGWEDRLIRAVEAGAGRPVLIGCMRPRGRPDVEVAALEAGAAGIAVPSATTVKELKERGWNIEWRQVCCALHR